MVANLKHVSCDRTCGFMIRSSDSQELITLFQLHAKEIHEMSLAADDIKQKIRKVYNNNNHVH